MLRPLCIEDNLDRYVHHQLLVSETVPAIEAAGKQKDKIWFQQDGANFGWNTFGVNIPTYLEIIFLSHG